MAETRYALSLATRAPILGIATAQAKSALHPSTNGAENRLDTRRHKN
jgi:hypothetical protein